MPLFIIGTAIIAGTTLFTNSRRKKAAEEAQALMDDQIDARNDLIAGYEADFQQTLIDYEEGKLPIPKIEVEKGKFGAGLTEAVAAAKNRDDVENALDQENVRLAAAANVSDPRIRAAVMNKANKESRQYIDEVAADVAKREIGALTNLGEAQTQVERDFANAKNEAEQQYAANAQQYFMNEVNRLSDLLKEQGENVFDLQYQAGMVVPMAQTQNAADFGNAAGDALSFGVDVGAFAKEGGVIKKEPTQASDGARIDYLDRFQDFMGSQGQGSALSGLTAEQIEKAAKMNEEMKENREKRQKERDKRREDRAAIKAFEESEKNKKEETTPEETDLDTLMNRARMARKGGVTQGEFNHGDLDDPMSGNDQVLIDQEDLMKGLNSGEITSYQDIEDMNMIQMISTGGEGVLDEDNFLDTNDLVDAANPNNPLKFEDLKLRDNVSAEAAMKDVLLAGEGTKVKGKGGKSQKEMDKAARLLAKYLSVVLSEPQFQE